MKDSELKVLCEKWEKCLENIKNKSILDDTDKVVRGILLAVVQDMLTDLYTLKQ